jgi:tRNA-splicing ligase RtcB
MSKESPRLEVRRLDEYRWLIPRQGKMRVEGLIFADDHLMRDIRGDEAVQQVANVAMLPGIVGRSIGMPDIHWGYGFAIGGVAAFDPDEGGVISPGGVGYDINCGVRLLRSDLVVKDVRARVPALMDELMRSIPAGVGRGYKKFVLKPDDIRKILTRGAGWAIDEGFGRKEDLERIESGGVLEGADPGQVSQRAIQRGRDQVGTVGSGNHFIEVGYVDETYDDSAAHVLGLDPGTVTIFIHSGSRGLGYQVCDDYLGVMMKAAQRYGIDLPDRQLVCAPLESPEAKRYLGAMRAAANFAFANRQMMGHRVRTAFEMIFGRSESELGMELVYDVSGERFKDLGQPVLIPGDMGRYSFVLLGTQGAYDETFGSTCHGAGRRMSRRQAKRETRGRNLKQEFREQGIEVRASSGATVAEEVPEAYKDVADVVGVVDRAGIGRKVARLRPLGVLKG